MDTLLSLLVMLALVGMCVWLYRFITHRFIVKLPTSTSPPTGRQRVLRGTGEFLAILFASVIVLAIAASVAFGSDTDRGNTPLVEAWFIIIVGIPASAAVLHYKLRRK